MKIRIITSCTGDKKHSPANQLTQADFLELHNTSAFTEHEDRLQEYKTPAAQLYTGQQHIRLMAGVDTFQMQRSKDELDLWIVSAGYGLIPGYQPIVPYECTFQGMKAGEIRDWSAHLQILQKAQSVLQQPADLNIILLGDAYLRALALHDEVVFAAPTLFFTGKTSQKKVKGQGDFKIVTLSNPEAKRFSYALVGLKGELTRRILLLLAEQGKAGLAQLWQPDADILTILEAIAPPASQKSTKSNKKSKKTAVRTMTPNPAVDKVIHIPQSWWEKPHRNKLKYFIPDWDDQVDPYYDFLTDTHSGGRGDWSNQTYAHQMFPEPNYDGILISKVVAEKSKKKKERINEMGVHRYLRVPREYPIMGDCGAFGYVKEEVPPYTTQEILDYYTRLDFDYGVSLDHLVFASDETGKFRYDLTIANAETFLREHQQQKLPWTPIGAVQGWDPQSYAEAARQYVAMGYQYIALGGLVRTRTPEILRILDAVKPVVPDSVSMHIFGVARTDALAEFAKRGVRSVDSASYLRQAWMRTKTSYSFGNTAYAAIRIPEAGKSFRAKQMEAHPSLTEEKITKMEQDALKTIRAYAQNKCSLETCLDALMTYDQYVTSDRVDMTEPYRRTLTDRPWEKCGCSICQEAGVEVIIFRGNNRNRRRGFHNTYVLYQLIQQLLDDEVASTDTTYQLSLL